MTVLETFSLDTGSALALHQGYTLGRFYMTMTVGWTLFWEIPLNENQSNALFHNTGTGNN